MGSHCVGYIYKVVDEQNRRNFLIYLTEKGVTEAEESLELEKGFWDVFLSDFSIDEIIEMQKLLAKLENNIRQFKK